MTSSLNGKGRRQEATGDLAPLGSDDYHSDLTLSRRARRRAIDTLASGDEWPDDETTRPEVVIPQAPPAPIIRYEPIKSIRAGAEKIRRSRPLQVSAITAIIMAVSSAVVAIIEALK